MAIRFIDKARNRMRTIFALLESKPAGRSGSRPQQSGRKARRPLGGWHNWALGLVCLLVIGFAITSIGSSSSGAESAERTAEVGRGVVQSTVSGNGSLEAAEQVELDFGASGEVTDIYVKAGEQVEKGETLARIDSSSARASLASAEAQLAEAEETLEAAEEAEVSTTYETTGTTVLASFVAETGDTTAAPETTAPEDEEAKEKEAKEKKEKEKEAKEKEAKEKEKEAKQEEQSPQGGEGAGSAPTQEAPVEESASPESGGSSMEGSTGGATVSVATAEASLRQAELSVQSAEQEVSETALRAPFSGTVASISGSVGETVTGEGSASAASSGSSTESSSGGFGAVGGESSSSSTSSSTSSAFIVLSQLDRLKMEVSFSESDIGKLKVGQPATVSISSMEGVELAGRVTKVDVLPGEGSSGVVEYPATILLTQHAQGLRAGMSASAEVVVEQATNAITVPSEAISSGMTKTVTVKEDGKEVQKEITTGLVGDETTEVLSGVKPGETLVLPEVTVASGGEGGGEGGLPEIGGGSGGVPSFGGGGLPSGGGFPGAP